MAKAMIKCPKTGKLFPIGMDLPKNFKEMGNVFTNSKVNCPHCGNIHTFSTDDLFFEED